MRQDGHEAVRARLREAAGAHEPDRARMLARVERGMAGRGPVRPPARSWSGVRVAGATAAVAGVLAAGAYAVAVTVRDDGAPAHRTVAVSPVPRPAPASSAPGAVSDGPLWSDGSVDPHSNAFWAQSNVTVRTTEPLAALTVRLRIAQTGGVTSTGAWRSLPEADFTLTTAERAGFLVYTWTLKPGRTVPAGTWVFAGQYDHDRGGRDAGNDSYTAAATENLAVTGGFTAHDASD